MTTQQADQTSVVVAKPLCQMHKSSLQFFGDGAAYAITEVIAHNRRAFFGYSEATVRASVSKLVKLGYLSKRHIGGKQYLYQITESGKAVNGN